MLLLASERTRLRKAQVLLHNISMIAHDCPSRHTKNMPILGIALFRGRCNICRAIQILREFGKKLRLGMDEALSIRVSNGLKVEMYQMYQIKEGLDFFRTRNGNTCTYLLTLPYLR